jgi:hypothetical protein|tara:strand:+ start:1619 stop:2428 length:810 start_codon:yes stop_codon:yes gene_type:complete
VRLIELDKAGSEWVITAYLAGEPRMIEVVESGIKPHVVTGSLITGVPQDIVIEEHALLGDLDNPDDIEAQRKNIAFGPTKFLPRTMSIYQCGKKSNHAFNYGLGAKKWARINEVAEGEAIKVRKLYLKEAYPDLDAWWRTVQEQLKEDRTLHNCFGRKRIFRDRWDDELFKAAYAWNPQSTSVEIVNRAMVKFWQDERPEMQRAELLLHRHDSLTFQHPGDDDEVTTFIQGMCTHMEPTLTWGGREFVVGTSVKMGPNLGEMKPCQFMY